jgi:F-type H+-transporting ATPase subunit a
MEQAENPLVIPTQIFSIFGFENWINPLTVSFLVFGLILILLTIACSKSELIPTGVQNFMELIVEFIENMSGPIVGKHADFFFPLFFMLFTFIFFGNLMGLVPGSVSPTSRVDVNLGMALIVFFSTHFWGVKEKGFLKYLAHFLPPKISADPKSPFVLKMMMWVIYGALCVMMPLIHLIGELVKPISLTMRLFGNMMAKEKILAVTIVLTTTFWAMPGFKMISVFPLLLRVFIIILGVFVSFIQAFVFMLLAMLYVGGAVQDHEHGEHEEAEDGHERAVV